MQYNLWILLFLSIVELFLFVLILVFFSRLRRSEQLLVRLQNGQAKLMSTLLHNEELEQQLVASFAERQDELRKLDIRLEERAETLKKLLEQAETVSRSPQFLRELILSNARKGKKPAELAKITGLSLDEVELILAEAGK